MFCLTKESIYQNLVSWLGADIGTYQENGISNNSIPAIAILPDPNFGYDYPPDSYRAIGIEIVVRETMPKHTPLLNQQAIEEEIWEIYLKNWEETIEDAKGELKLLNMGKTLALNLTRNGVLFSNSDVIPGNEELNLRPQIKFVLRQPGSIN
ncbi:MAG: hypothetical protein QNJ38_01285 [Prochloraceae cyanobacterium]|nr:hypothetical protein [Prochloraceae cyanobacterium]